MSDRSKSGMGGSKSKSKSKSKSSDKPHEIHVRRAHGGGFIAKHHKKHKPGEDMEEPQEHVIPDMDQLQAHLQDNLGDQPPAGMPAADPSQAMPPQQGAPAPAPAPAPQGM